MARRKNAPKLVQVTMTERQAELLGSLLSRMNGMLQYRATKVAHLPHGEGMDRTFDVWDKINGEVAASLGMSAFMQDSVHVTRLLDVVQGKI